MLRVSGTPGAAFAVQCQVGTMHSSVSTTIPTTGGADVLDFPGRNFNCDLQKDRAADVTAELIQRGNSVFRARAPRRHAGRAHYA